MANAAATEICCLDDMNVDALLSIDSSLVMSFLEDTQAREGDDEMLRAMMQSLEPEIANQDSCSETDCSDECRFSQVDQLECCSTSPHHYPDFEWIDMEMDYSCPSYEMMSGYFTENMVEVEGLEDYSQVYCYGMPMEEDDYIGLWQ